MPLPPTPITLHGGCGCKAVRYVIRIPKLEKRPVHPSLDVDRSLASTFLTSSRNSKECRLPFICFDHCDDCRAATGSILPAWIHTPANLVEVSAFSVTAEIRSEQLANGKLDFGSSRPTYKPGLEMLLPLEASKQTFLRFYNSSPRRMRSFCGRCGTSIAYIRHPMPENWPDMISIALGTVDRVELEKYSMMPERQLWWDWGMPWVQGLMDDMRAEKHPSYKVNERVEDDD